MKKIIFILFSLLIFTALSAENFMSYQGHLIKDGEPDTGSRNITVKLYNSSDAVDPILTEQQVVEVDENGFFRLEYGKGLSTEDLNAIQTSESLFIEILVETVSLGRKEIGSTLRAFKALEADNALTLAGHSSSDFLMSDYAPQWSSVENKPALACTDNKVLTGVNLSDGTVSCKTDDNTGTAYAADDGINISVDNKISVDSTVARKSELIDKSRYYTVEKQIAVSCTDPDCTVTAYCNNSTDLFVSGFCNSGDTQYRLNKQSLTNLNDLSLAAGYKCEYKRATGSDAADISSTIVCITN